jgi:hypothetical protein
MTAIIMTASLLLSGGSGLQEAVDAREHSQFLERAGTYAKASLEAEAKERQRKAQRADRSSAPRSGACGGWDDLVAEYFGAEKPFACSVLMCESHGDPNAIGPVQRDGSPRPVGLMQIKGGSTDPRANLALAARMRKARGWQPWTCA